MKQLHAVVVGIVLVSFGWAMVSWHRIKVQVDAQESPKQSDVDPQSKSNVTPSQTLGIDGGRSYPVFYINDVVARLKDASQELIENKLAKNSDALREQLDRTDFSAMLPPALNQELPPQEVYRRAIESVFLVAGMTKPTDVEESWQTAFSTAFAVHEDGILSTSAHVFDHDDHDDAVVVLDVHGKIHPVVELLAVDRKADTCLFRIATKGLKPLTLGHEIPPGSEIRVIGHPGDSFFFFSAGHVANYEHDEDGMLWLNVTADFGQGSSGGPVMDGAGNVVGQVSRTFTLYAGDELTSRHRRPRSTRQTNDNDQKGDPKKENPGDDDLKTETESKKSADPQMVFKSCTPVSAIRALVK